MENLHLYPEYQLFVPVVGIVTLVGNRCLLAPVFTERLSSPQTPQFAEKKLFVHEELLRVFQILNVYEVPITQ